MDKDKCTVLFSVWCSSVSIANLPAIKLGESVNDHCQDTFRGGRRGKAWGVDEDLGKLTNAEFRGSNDLDCIWNSSNEPYCRGVNRMARSGSVYCPGAMIELH
jgi:hypothetical protein